jgi:oxygen-independent coproporphyrinogen-3 oxidase
LRYKDDFVKALAMEAEIEKDYLKAEEINTIYFGGGTPSILDISDLEFLIQNLRRHYSIQANPDITLETNPDNIIEEKLQAWIDLGINRLSIGVQSFFEEELRWMNRAHNAKQAVESIQLAKKYFEDITVDLIYGSPLLTDELWKQNVNRIIAMDIPHLSCYDLTVEEKTPLHKLISANKTVDVDNDKQARQFLLLMKWLRENGYEHYEVSNFAKKGFRSRHNSSYWKGEKYLGLGPSAHSYNGNERRWNIANNNLYIKSMNENTAKREIEILTPNQRLNELIMISLRTMEGLDLNKLEKQFGTTERARVDKQLQKFISHQLIKLNDGFAQLTDAGKLRADGIASELFA